MYYLIKISFNVFVLILLSFFVARTTFSQPFEIAWGVDNYFSIDKFSNEVYYYFLPANKIYKTSLKTLVSSETGFPTIPRFANKSHSAIFIQQNDIYLVDFDLDSTYYLFSTSNNNSSSYVFSPNDSNVFAYDRYYSFQDNQVYDLSFEIDDWSTEYYEWSSDSTILSSVTGNVIVQYYLYSNKADTLFFITSSTYFTGYSYNRTRNMLSYSKEELPPKLHIYDFITQSDSIIFDPVLDDSSQVASCWSAPIAMTAHKWSPNEKRIGFFNNLLTNSGSGLYTYELDSSYTQMLLDCSNYGVKNNLEWLRNDTLIYYDATNSLIYGIEARPIVNDVIWDYDEVMLDNIYVSNYPNPFNGSTTISIYLPEPTSINVLIYDLLGNKIMELPLKEQAFGWLEYNWNGRSINNNEVSSGIYIVKIDGFNNSDFFSVNHKILLTK